MRFRIKIILLLIKLVVDKTLTPVHGLPRFD